MGATPSIPSGSAPTAGTGSITRTSATPSSRVSMRRSCDCSMRSTRHTASSETADRRSTSRPTTWRREGASSRGTSGTPSRPHGRRSCPPPQAPDVIEGSQIVHNTFVVRYLHDAYSQLRLFALDGTSAGEVALPTLGSIVQVTGEPRDTEMFYAFTSFLYPTTIFRHDFTTGKSSVFKAPEIAFDPAKYETVQLFYHSKDGTRVPLFLTYKKGLKQDGSNPTYLYGYGGFNVNLTPGFSIGVLGWLEMGGVYAQAVLRGGSEYGEEWHQAGMLDRKQNVFDDFIAAAEYLIAERYTSPPKLAI